MFTVVDMVVPTAEETKAHVQAQHKKGNKNALEYDFHIPRCGVTTVDALPVQTVVAAEMTTTLAQQFPGCTALEFVGEVGWLTGWWLSLSIGWVGGQAGWLVGWLAVSAMNFSIRVVWCGAHACHHHRGRPQISVTCHVHDHHYYVRCT